MCAQNNVKIGINGATEIKGGIYNMLASFGVGLQDAFRQKYSNSGYTVDYFNRGEIPNLSISFNTSGSNLWEILHSAGATNLVWSVDSLFYKNLAVFEAYQDLPNFFVISITDDDDKAANLFMPNLKLLTLPVATCPDIWYSKNIKKTRDIVFLASIQDVDEQLLKLKETFSKETYAFYMQMYEYALENSQKNMWEVFTHFINVENFPLDSSYEIYKSFAPLLTYHVSYKERIKAVEALKDFNVEVWGEGPWEKFTRGKAKYMGSANVLEAKKIIEESKMSINLQPMQVINGIHERIMNSSVANSFVLTDKNKTIYGSYGDNLGYIDKTNFDSLAEMVYYYLQNDEERIGKAYNAQQITLKNHTWLNRVDSVLELLSIR